mmetsp:Transcript_33597/g.49157  ORF Transcript_33597/g.49157 Transcript_33597/m.49157 type:complete len:247 (-) Transcript_33597:180-920(-)
MRGTLTRLPALSNSLWLPAYTVNCSPTPITSPTTPLRMAPRPVIVVLVPRVSTGRPKGSVGMPPASTRAYTTRYRCGRGPSGDGFHDKSTWLLQLAKTRTNSGCCGSPLGAACRMLLPMMSKGVNPCTFETTLKRYTCAVSSPATVTLDRAVSGAAGLKGGAVSASSPSRSGRAKSTWNVSAAACGAQLKDRVNSVEDVTRRSLAPLGSVILAPVSSCPCKLAANTLNTVPELEVLFVRSSANSVE